MTKGLSKGNLLAIIIALYWEKRFSKESTKNPKSIVPACLDFTFSTVGYNSSTEPQIAIHIHYVNYENALPAKE